jgi:hypothetical protein
MLSRKQKTCNRQLCLFAWATSLRIRKNKQIYAVFHLQSQFGLSEPTAKLIAELSGLNSNIWGA